MGIERQKILIIDDTPANITLLGMALKDHYEIQIATSGKKGLELASETPPDLVLLDIMMPDLDGYETCRLFKADERLRHIPIIFVTALSEIEAEIHGLSLGAADFLIKPFNLQIAQLRVRNLLETERMRQALRQTEEDQRLAATVFAYSHDGIVITDVENRIINVNNAFSRITGYGLDEIKGENPRILKSGRQDTEFYQNMWQALLSEGHWSGEIWNRNKQGEIYAALTSIAVVRDDQDSIHHFIGSFIDITPIKEHQHALERIAHFDPLTGVPNRFLLSDRLEQAIVHTRRSRKLMAVCYLDLDEFKPINDRFGHQVGDQLLIEITRRIKACLREGDTLARIGGDEFVLLLLDINDRGECKTILRRILKAVSAKMLLANQYVSVSLSLGFTLYPDDFSDTETLIRHADQAMYQAKQQGKNRFQRFDMLQEKHAYEQGKQLARIECALANNEFVLYFQPKINLRDGAILGVEALIRWQHPARGLLSPSMFLPMIQGSQLEINIGDWVLSTALSRWNQWKKAGVDIAISINIAAGALLHPDFVENLSAKCAEYPDLQSGCLELEILETGALDDDERAIKVMKACQALGVVFALDDFGTGYSSLSYLKSLPAKTLKIDRSFVLGMLENEGDLAIVKGIIDLASIFKMQVISEGVETVAHLLKLLELGCENGQGYAIAKPMPEEDLLNWLKEWQLEQKNYLKKAFHHEEHED
ncbi:GGDEF/EAL domain-containing response regulator [Methylotuvimicrobium alcaliphilum]|uniref:Diguanylate cyclase n=1 Tax=Methylotuvimicrobium alcaliphilum (strain DSM 19304 / NCIMB 14124 / VKM B-2133 / 20Z) TaxID=1091494 RepID=G4SXU1_META2|nr:EAL domain-containing protein [Methylotuvimicrobium alcaliphilum]CCE23135.1 putative Diguanylate cyclase [Methylotuvimicrobium alcaliphilum 20Z]